MKKHIITILMLLAVAFGASSCFNLDEKVFDRVDASVYYEDESSVKSAVASIYNEASRGYAEYFYYLQEFSADQVAWRSWNGGLWGYDEAQKYVLSCQNWTADSKIIRQTWETAWTAIGLCNHVIEDLRNIDPAKVKMTQEKINSYIAEVRTLRAWAYYNVFEIWGGALPLNISTSTDIPATADPDFDTSCKKIYNFIATELDESVNDLPKNEVNRMNQAANRVIKARLLLNSEIFIKEDHFADCANLCQSILNGDFGTYKLTSDYRDIYGMNNDKCPEVIMAFAYEVGKTEGAALNMRDVPFLPYNVWDAMGLKSDASGWNCCCLEPSYDNSGTVLATGGTTGATCFLDAPYNDKLGAVYARFDDRDIRKQAYTCDTKGNWKGLFIKGAQKDYKTGKALKADADRDGQDLVYVDQVGTFLQTNGVKLETVMSPRWGETNSGYRLIRYPIYPDEVGFDFRNADEVEFRLSEVVYMLAECKLRAGDATAAKDLVNTVRQRYFSATDWAVVKDQPGPGFTAFDKDWMLSEWGKEFLGEGRRRRTDLRRFNKFTQGQWWFFGRTSENFPAKRNEKYEWFPLPSSALLVNPGLIQNPNYK